MQGETRLDTVAFTARIALALLLAATACSRSFGFTLSTPSGQRRAVWRGRGGGRTRILSPRLVLLLVSALLAVGLATSCIAVAVLTVASIRVFRTGRHPSNAEYRRWFAVAATAAATALCLSGPGPHSMDHQLSVEGPSGLMFALIGGTVALVTAAAVLVSRTSATGAPEDSEAALRHYLPV